MKSKVVTTLFILLTGIFTSTQILAFEFAYDATAGSNSLSTGQPIRGFEDSQAFDVWVPFNFDFRPPKAVTNATIKINIRPIGQLTNTDLLLLKGNDGKVVEIKIAFGTAPTTEFRVITIEITQQNVLDAIKTGKLEGVVQDDSAVKSVELIFNDELTSLESPQLYCLFNWAEEDYADLFAPDGIPAVWSVYTYRYYSATNAYLGVSSVDNHVYYLGPDLELQNVGPLSFWLPQTGC